MSPDHRPKNAMMIPPIETRQPVLVSLEDLKLYIWRPRGVLREPM